MSNANTPQNDAELEAFLARDSVLTAAYDSIEPLQPPEMLDAKILAIAAGAAKPGAPAPAPNTTRPVAPSRPPVVPRAPAAHPVAPGPRGDDEDDEDDSGPVPRRPRWHFPVALAASLLAAVGVGVFVLTGDREPVFSLNDAGDALSTRAARNRREADKATAEVAASREAKESELAALPPPPVFEPEGPRVEDLDKAIALIRRELVLASQRAAMAADDSARMAPSSAAPAGSVADAPAPAAEAEVEADSVIQSRDRRLAKVMELYDAGKTELATAALEIFLRDFEDYPISQRILEAQPKATDVAVE